MKENGNRLLDSKKIIIIILVILILMGIYMLYTTFAINSYYNNSNTDSYTITLTEDNNTITVSANNKTNGKVDCDFTSVGIKNNDTINKIADVTYNNGGWLITPSSSSAYAAYRIYSLGNINANTSVYNTYGYSSVKGLENK